MRAPIHCDFENGGVQQPLKMDCAVVQTVANLEKQLARLTMMSRLGDLSTLRRVGQAHFVLTLWNYLCWTCTAVVLEPEAFPWKDFVQEQRRTRRHNS